MNGNRSTLAAAALATPRAAESGMESALAMAPRTFALRRLAGLALEGFSWRGLGAVVVFCAVYGAVLSTSRTTGGAPDSMAAYLVGFVQALMCYVPVFVVVSIATNFAPSDRMRRTIVLGLIVLVAVAIAYAGITALQQLLLSSNFPQSRHFSPLPLVTTCWLGLAICLAHEGDLQAARTLSDEAEYQLNLGRQLSEAQLQVLQSQIEPHFLFNTLAHVRRLYRTDPDAGRTMMRHLSHYLSAALPALRETGIPLSVDLELAAAYLNIQQIRMGPRLAFALDIPASLGETRVPPMTLTTLVENAIKHGLSPLPEGGHVRVAAQADGDRVVIDVSDNGRGFHATIGGGVGLANIRARLEVLHGTLAQLSLCEATPCGVTATVIVPMRIARSR